MLFRSFAVSSSLRGEAWNARPDDPARSRAGGREAEVAEAEVAEAEVAAETRDPRIRAVRRSIAARGMGTTRDVDDHENQWAN